MSGADAAADERTDHWPTETIRYTGLGENRTRIRRQHAFAQFTAFAEYAYGRVPAILQVGQHIIDQGKQALTPDPAPKP